MPVIARSAEGKVVSLWGTALIRGTDGKLRLLKVGDVVRQGDQILTTQDGIVQIENGESPVRAADAKAPTATDDVEQAITALNRGDRDAAPAAGLAGGGDGSMQEGLRVDRIAEGVSGGEVPRSTADADLRVVSDSGSSPTAAADQGGSSLPPLDAPSSTISTSEEGAPANLGLTAPTGAASGGTIRVDQVPVVGEIRKADGTLVTAGTVLTPADLPGLTYVPPADYDGGVPPGGFTYTLTTTDGSSSSGGTSITLSPVNDAPVATAGSGTGNEDAALPISLGGTDVDGRIVGVTVTALPAGGSLWLADGVTPVAIGQTLAPADAATLVYRPGADFNGSQTLEFTVTDNSGATSAPASIALTVVAVNDAPLAADDAARAVGTAPVRIDVLANDRDADGDTLTVVSASVDPALGTVTVNADGTLSFAAAPGVTGPVAMTYTVADASGATSSATLSVNVAAGPAVTVDAPALTSDATPIITGTSNLPAGSTVAVVVTDAAGASQALSANVTASGSFAVTVPAALAEGGYTAVATASDAFGNIASASDGGTIDLTAPSLVVNAPALTNDTTPTISGSTNLPAGSAISLVITDSAGVTQILTVTASSGGAFSVDVPAALAEGGYTVVATATDAAGNSASANDAGSVDVTAPSITVDAPSLTGNSTPTITGTTDLPAGSTVSLVVTDALGASQTITATVAAGGTYSAAVPAALAEGSFTVIATVTDAAGNSATANDAGAVDITAPSITVDVPALTNDSTPTITGTTDLPARSSISLVVTDALGASQTITATVAAGGTYSINVPVALAEGSFTVVATATDAAGNTASANDAGAVDVTAPSITVDAPALTNDPTPTFSGTTNLPAGSAVTLVVTDAPGASQTITATVAAGGTYSVAVPVALAEGSFTVVAMATDAAGNSATANDAGAVDVTAPSITVDAPALTNDSTPTITGTTSLPAGSTVSLVVTDALGASQTITATVAGGGTYSVAVPAALAEGSFTVVATATDAAGNSATANDAGAVDVTAPSITVDAPTLTNDSTPVITGTTDLPASATISLVVTDALGASQTVTTTVAAGGTYSVNVPLSLAEGSFTVVATATDAAGNTSSANDAGAVDVTAPSITVDAPTLTNDSTPTITGTTNLPAGSTVSLVVTDAIGASQTITATVASGEAYSVDVPVALAEGSFTVVATATDAAGNSANANDAGSVDISAPTITVDAPALTNDSTPTITGTTSLPAGSTVSLVVTDALGASQTINATVAAGGTYSVAVPAALAEGSFTVVASATDAAGNTASANDAGAVDVTAPSIAVDAPALTNDATPTITGTTNLPAGSTVSLVVTDALGASQTITATVASGGTYSVAVPVALAEGSFTVIATATDAAGNFASANDAGAVDVSAPSISVDAPALTNDTTPTITGTTSLPAGSTVSLVITDALGASQNITATIAAGGTYSVNVPVVLAEGGFTVVATATDAAGNTASANDAGAVDVTAPSVTVNAPTLTNDSTPTITGTTSLPAGATVSLVVTDALGASQTITATVAAGGTYSVAVPAALAEGSFTVIATVTDAAGNSANANDVGSIDVTAPSITVDAPALTNDSTPTITGTTDLPTGSTVSLLVTDALGASQTVTATVATGGTYSVDVPVALVEGGFTVVATATDAAGNTSSANDSGAVDVTAPSITVDAPALTNDSTPTITGTTNLPAGSTISLVVTDALAASQTIIATVAAGGTYSVDVPAALAEGSFTVVATATDAAGNTTSANDAGAVDVTAPSVTVDAPALTNDATPTITGTTDLPIGSTVSLLVTDALGASQAITATVAAGGTYSVNVPVALAEGNFTVVASAIDAAGNTASANDAGAVDVTAPSITVDAPALTNDSTPTITGTTNLPAGSTVSLLVTDALGASQTVNATVATGGTYSVVVPVSLAEGNFTVVATAADAAGNSANANDAGTVDISAPTITVAAPALTNDATPTITGTTNLPAGSAISLVVTDALGSSQAITALVAAGGTYSVDVPVALAEGSFTIVATATDAAGNSATSNDAGAVDVTAPSITVDAPALTNDSTPTISGTTNLPAGSTVSLVVTDAIGASQTITATVASGGAYSVDVPVALAEGSFTVVATATDAAGNSANANDAGSVDISAPTITVDAPALTNDSTPTITGTTSLPAGSTVSLVVTDALGASQTIAATVAAGGAYSVAVPTALAEGSFTVVATATDAAGNTASANDAGAVDVTAPSLTVDAPALTNDATPTITGTTNLPAGSTVSLVVTDALGASQTINATVAAGGTYSVAFPVSLAEGSFTVVATATDAAGNSATANDAGTVDITAPSITIDAPALTNDSTPTISGTTSLPAGSTVSLVVTDALGASQTITATVAAGGTYSVAIPVALAEGNFTVVATATDAAGNTASANDAGAVDVTAPSITADAPALTNDATPTITGTTNLPAGSTVSLVVTDALGASQTITATVVAGGTYSVAVPAALAEGSFTVVATATDAAGNAASANDAGAVDVTAPSITVDAPALTNDSTPIITGTTNLPAGSTISLVVTDALGASQTISATVAASGTYSVNVPVALAEGSFTVVATATDAAGNSANANDVGSIDVTAPGITVDAPALTNDSTPTISGTTSLPAGSTVSLVVTDALGASQTITATIAAGGTYSVNVPLALAEGGFTVVATATDAAGNTASVNDAGAVDITAPIITVDAPALTNDSTPVITGTTDLPAGSTVSLVVTDALGSSQAITALVAAGGTYSVAVPVALAEGSFTVFATATDAAGNTASANDAGAVDVTAPSITVDAPALTNDTTPTITGTTNLPAGSIISLVVTDALGASQTINATVAAGGTYSVDVPAALAEGSFTVVATATDAAGNSANANDAGSVDISAPTITVDAPTLTNDSTPTITGTTNLPAGSSISLVVTDALGASQTITATVAAGGTYSVDVPTALAEGNFTVVATATDAAGNSASANDAGSLDLTAPTVTLALSPVTADNVLSSAEAGGNVVLSGVAGGDAVAGDSVVLTIHGQNYLATVGAGGSFSVSVPGSALAADVDTRIDASITLTDAAGNSSIATATQTYGVNTPPAGTDRTVVTAEDSAYQFSAADFGYTDANGQPLAAVRIDSLPGAGQLLLGGVAVVAGQQIAAADLANLRFVPVADANGNGYASFSFSVGDGLDFDATPNQLTIDVTPANDAPVAQPAAFSVAEDAAVVSSAVTALDIDAGTTLTFALNGAQPAGLTFNANGTYSFDPSVAAYQSLAAGQSTVITVPFTATDNAGATSTANLVITVTGTNDTPVAAVDTGSVAENATLTATATTGLLSNDTDLDAGSTLTVSAVGFGATAGTVGSALAGTYGTLTLNADGSYSYAANRPAADALTGGQVVTETFAYTVRDAAGATATTTVTFTITGTNDAPTITGPLTGSVQEDGTLTSTGTLLITDSDAGQSSFVAQTATPGTYGSFAITAGGVWTYTLNNAAASVQALPGGAAPTETFTVTTADGSTRTITVTVTGSNDAAVIPAGTGSITEDVGVTAGNLTTGGTLTVTDVDSGQASFQPQAATAGTYGSFTLAASGAWTYAASNASPAIQSLRAGQTLTDTFTVRSADGTTSTVTVTIIGTNDAPVANSNTGPAVEDTTLTIVPATLLSNDTDVDSGSTLSIVSVQSPVNGSVALVGGNIVFTPAANYSGPASFTYTISDGQGGTSTATVTLNVGAVADAPTLVINGTSNTGGTVTPPNLPPSSGLVREFFRDITTVSSSNAGNIGAVESAVDAATATSTTTISDIFIADLNVDDAYQYSGYVYLEAGQTYQVSGSRDDTLMVKLGGTTVYGVGFNNWGAFTASGFTPSVSGYYSLEVVAYNGDGVGDLDINMSINAGPALDLNTSNFRLYANPGDFTGSPTVAGPLVPNGDGGYYPAAAVGTEDSSIRLGTIGASLNDADGSETLSLAIGNIPVGAVITDGTNSFTATAGSTSVNVTGWSLGNLSITPPLHFSGTINLSVTATATEASGPAASTTGTLPVTVTAVTDAPVVGGDTAIITVVQGTGTAATVNFPILATRVDADGSETLRVLVSGVPSGASFSAGTDNGGGVWEFTQAQLDNLTLTMPAGSITTTTFTVTAVTREASTGAEATDSSTITLYIENTSNNQNGNDSANTFTFTNSTDHFINALGGNDIVNAGGGEDLVRGGDGDDTIRGDNDNDALWGDAGNDIILGGDGSDLIRGGAGNDTLTGGATAGVANSVTDVFAWSLGDQGSAGAPAVDTITDFNTAAVSAGGDVLDLRDLLSGDVLGAGNTGGNLANFLDFSVSGSGASAVTTIRISSSGQFTDGNYAAGAEDQTIVLQGVDLPTALGLAGGASDAQIVQELINRGKLIVDSVGP